MRNKQGFYLFENHYYTQMYYFDYKKWEYYSSYLNEWKEADFKHRETIEWFFNGKLTYIGI